MFLTRSTDQKVCYKLIQAVKLGHLPQELQYILCGNNVSCQMVDYRTKYCLYMDKEAWFDWRGIEYLEADFVVLFYVLLQSLL